jgi:hypothetical protein
MGRFDLFQKRFTHTSTSRRFKMVTTRVPLFFAVITVTMAMSCSLGLYADDPQFLPPQQVGTVQQASINEASGLAASILNSDVLWTHNDSGDTARTFAMDTQGNHLGIYNITGAGATDWEDMAVGPGPAAGASYLYLGDIGDNNAIRGSVNVYRVPEPSVSVGQLPVNVNLAGDTIRLTYPDGARDAETLMVDPLTNDLYVISKRESKSRVYLAAYPQSTTQTTVMQYLGELPWSWATGGGISPDGSEIIIRGYFNASLWLRPTGGTIWDALSSAPYTIPLASEAQGESICFDSASQGYFTVSEGSYPPLYYYQRIPDPTLLEGDANHDDVVSASDYASVQANFGNTGEAGILGDANGDGVVSASDYASVQANFGNVSPAKTTIPEPATLFALAFGTVGILCKRRRA